MVLAGKAMGGDDRFIAALQALRVMLVVAGLSLWFKFTAGLSGTTSANGPGAPLSLFDAVLLLGCGLGVVPALALKLPAALLVGPMLCSVALHVLGLTEGKPPDWLIILAQIIVGASVGCRFKGWTIGDFRSAGALSLLLTLLMLAIAFAVAGLMHRLTGQSFPQLLLAFAPGGVAEMSLIALTLGQGVAFVATHHVFRIFLIVLVMPLAFRFGAGRG
jgi:membrane AbrB-like protein